MQLNQHAAPTREHFRILLVSWAGWVFDFYDLVLFSFLLGPIGDELGLSRGELSYVLGASLAATALGGAVFGFFSDHFGRKRTLSWTILAYSLGTLLCGFAKSIEMLLLFRVITGLGVGGEWATGQTYIGETFPASVRGRYGAVMQTGAPVGIALASIVGGFAAPHIGWRACFVLSFLPALLVVYIRKHLPESDLWEKNRKSALARRNAGKAESGEENQARANARGRVSEPRNTGKIALLLSPAYRKLFVYALILALFDMSAYWFTYSWLPTYLHEERHFSMTKSAAWILVTQSGGLLGYLSFGVFADRYGRRLAFSVYSTLMAMGLVMVTLFWTSIVAMPALILFFMFMVGFGTGTFGGYGPLFAELFPTTIRGTAMGTAFNLARGVQFFTPVAITGIAKRYGLAGGISLAALFALLGGAWIWVFPETKGRVLDD